MKQPIIAILALLALSVSSAAAGDSLDAIKRTLSGAEATRFDFLSIVESDIFERTDTTAGTLYICKTGRYDIQIGGDRYLYNLEFLYSYSQGANQVTVEKLDPVQAGAEDLSFLTRLDQYFTTETVEPDHEYRLVKKDSRYRNLPDSMRVTIDPSEKHLSVVEYLDANEELNRLVITGQQSFLDCDSTRFLPNFPDSVETINLW